MHLENRVNSHFMPPWPHGDRDNRRSMIMQKKKKKKKKRKWMACL